MTTIAVRSGVMACDSAWSDSQSCIIALQTKVVHTKHNVLIGCAGDCSDRDIVEMLKGIRSSDELPLLKDLRNTVQDKSELEILLYFPDRQIFIFQKGEDSVSELIKLDVPYAAIGSGAAHALTAMDLDCSAYRAVEMACRRDNNSRLPVHSYTFRTEKKTRKRRR